MWKCRGGIWISKNSLPLGRFRSAKMCLNSKFTGFVTFKENTSRIKSLYFRKADKYLLLVLPLFFFYCLSICAFLKTFSLNGDFSLSPHLLSSQGMIPFFTLCTCSPVKMWQIAEFKCSKMWSKTAAPNQLHKEEFRSFSFSSYLTGIPYSLCPDWVTGNVRGL